MNALTLLEKVPVTFWAVVVGSLFTVIGVVLTNWSNTRRLRLQLEHDRTLKDRERDLAMRRDIYLAAAEAISAGMAAIGRFGDLNVAHDKLLQPYTERAPAIAKVHIVANDNTIRAVVTFMEELTGAFLRLSTKRIRLAVLQQRLRPLQDQLELSSREQDRVLALMKEFNLAGITDEQRWGVLQQSFEFEGRQIEELLKEQGTLQTSLLPLQLSLVQESLVEVAALNGLLVPIVGFVRTELDLPFNEKLYVEVIEHSRIQHARYFEEFIRDATAGLSNVSAGSAAG